MIFIHIFGECPVKLRKCELDTGRIHDPNGWIHWSIAAWPKKVSLLVFGMKPRREKVADTWGLFHFLGVNFWEMIGLAVFFPIKLVDGIELISSIVLGSSAPCQTAAYWVTRRRLLWSSRASGCKTTICSGC